MKVLIVGMAKSGTTGLYQTIKSSMNKHLGETIGLFEPKTLAPLESFIDSGAEQNLVCKVMLKKRYLQSASLSKIEKKILIVRDPRDRLLSALLFKGLSRPKQVKAILPQFIDMLESKERDPSAISLYDLAERVKSLGLGDIGLDSIEKDLRFQIELIREGNFFQVAYEDFVSENFSKLNDYLGFSLIENKSQTNWLKHIERSRSFGEWTNWYLQSDVDRLREHVGPLLEDLGYDDWSLPESQHINAELSSKHIRLNFDKRLAQMNLSASKSLLPINLMEFNETLVKASDGRVDDIVKVATTYLQGTSFLQADLNEAKYWLNIGRIFGYRKCSDMLDAV